MSNHEKKAAFSEDDLSKRWEEEDLEHMFDDIERDEEASLQSTGLQFSPADGDN
jgi:hypothetical protein